MRFREFAPRKRNRDQQVDEVLPAIGAVGGALARGATALGGAALRGAGNLAVQGAKTLGKAAGSAMTGALKQASGATIANIAKTAGQAAGKALFTPQGMQRQMGAQPGAAAGAQAGQQTPPVQIKPGVKILHPGLGPIKIKTIQGKDAVLDTQKELGQDVRVDQNELLAVLGQGQQVQK